MADIIPENSAAETTVELGRLSGLSDGVFSIALTLLVLEIRVPEDALAGELPASLLALAPQLLVYLISFIVIGGAWGSHQRMLSQIRRGDGVLVWLNLLSLLFVTLLPASAALLGRFPETLAAILCFALDVILIQLSALLLWRHASTSRLINAALDTRVVASIGRRLVLSASAFLLSIPLALWNVTLVYVVWIGLFLLIFTTDWLSWQQAIRTMKVTVPLDGAARAEISVVHGAGYLKVEAGGAADQLIAGTFGGGVTLRSTRDGDVLKTQLNGFENRGLMSLHYPWAWGSDVAQDWILILNPRTPVKLSIEKAFGQAALDFRDAQIENLSVETSASSAELWLPANAGLSNVRIEGNSASLIIHVPLNVAARVRAAKALSSLEVDLLRFPVIVDGREYGSPDYETAANKVDIQLEMAFGSAKIV